VQLIAPCRRATTPQNAGALYRALCRVGTFYLKHAAQALRAGRDLHHQGETDRVCIRLLLAPCFPERPVLPYPMCDQRASDTMQTLFTLGYQGHTIVTFLDVLQAHGIMAVLDVRERPYSRKPDFSKKRLSAHLVVAGIDYVHIVELGTPKPIRDEVRRSKDYAAFFAAVRPLVEAEETALQAVLTRARAETCAMLCYEGPITECHRLAVAEALLTRAGGALAVVHL
jgi:Protein of unknown function, DUF488